MTNQEAINLLRRALKAKELEDKLQASDTLHAAEARGAQFGHSVEKLWTELTCQITTM